MKYCLPIIKKTKNDVLAMLEEAKDYQFVEIWVDYIEDLDTDFMLTLLQAHEEKLIIVLRRKDLEPPKLSPERQIEIIKRFVGKKSYVDLDVVAQTELLNTLLEEGVQLNLITSYHNYSLTPMTNVLTLIIEFMRKYKPHIFKIATQCNNENDALRLLEILITLKQQNLKYIVLGMGEFGTITRVFGTLWGNELVFAPLKKEEQSAPGQLTKTEMQTIVKTLKGTT